MNTVSNARRGGDPALRFQKGRINQGVEGVDNVNVGGKHPDLLKGLAGTDNGRALGWADCLTREVRAFKLPGVLHHGPDR